MDNEVLRSGMCAYLAGPRGLVGETKLSRCVIGQIKMQKPWGTGGLDSANAYLTLRMPCIPAARWPGNVQT